MRNNQFSLGKTFGIWSLAIAGILLANINFVKAQVQDTEGNNLKYPIVEKSNNPFEFTNDSTPLYLSTPAYYENDVTYDPERNEFIIQRKVGGRNFGAPIYKSFDEYKEEEFNQSLKSYWVQKVTESDARKSGRMLNNIRIGGKAFETIFGSNKIDIRPQGSAELSFGVIGNRRDDPRLDVRQQRTANFDFQQKIQMNVTAKIGDRIELKTNYNTEASFEFENKMNLNYEGDEDDILQKIELGDVNLPLPGTLISGSQSLFGIKTKWKFGKTTVTTIFSQQKSESKTIEVSGGAQVTEFEIKADEYEENKHFLMSQYFREEYNESLEELPLIKSKINITKIEVWVTEVGTPTGENRNIVAFQDLGEASHIYHPDVQPVSAFVNNYGFIPDNFANELYARYVNNPSIRNIAQVNGYLEGQEFSSGIDYEFIENARKLNPSEYNYNSKLGFISLNFSLNPDQVLAVAFQYNRIGDTTTYTVGEFSNGSVEGQQSLIVKLLKSSATNTQIPLWDLMMKNVYALGGYQINSDDFRFNVLYENEGNGLPAAYLPKGVAEGIPLIEILNLDSLNTNEEKYADGIFDFIDGAATGGGTVQSSNGRIYFPVLEPFGSHLKDWLAEQGEQPSLYNKYAYDSLYSTTKYRAREFPEKNKFIMAGTYKSSASNDISLNAMNVPPGSVTVTAGGVPLTENVDYTVDYTLGRVKIINDAYMNSGVPIRVNFESNSLFNIQTKTLLGTHIDYQVNNDFIIGATVMNMTERPLTQKINMGDEPISNTIWGLNASYQMKSRFLTKMVDKLPFVETKAESNITIDAEFAHLVPGHNKAIGQSGTAYIDDFEGSKSTIDLKTPYAWKHSSTPSDYTQFEYGGRDSLANNFNRSKIAWYVIDPLFYSDNNLTPKHIKGDAAQLSDHLVRQILETEVFPNKELPSGQPANLPVLNVAFYPEERGPYNFNIQDLNAEGKLDNPQTKWGGIMRSMANVSTDFEATNIEYIEFWMMDPFVNNPDHSGGEVYFHLGDISEDILKDGRKSFENGLPSTSTIENVDTTVYGRVPNIQALTNSFSQGAEEFQDIGLDGLNDADESLYFSQFMNAVQATVTDGAARQQITEDPAADNYHYFRGSDFDNAGVPILDRYKMYNLIEGNSVPANLSPESYATAATSIPDKEDLNEDNTLNQSERYFEYKIDLKPDQMIVGENYITDKMRSVVPLKNNTTGEVDWYQFKIPVDEFEKQVGSIQDFKSIRFMRMVYKGFQEPIICRFATFELVRGEWRKITNSLLYPGEYVPNDNNATSFNISTVNIEENGKRTPIPYVLPPEIEREVNIGSTNLNKLNEQSLSIRVSELEDGDSRAIYKNTAFDFRRYGKLKMFVHAEKMRESDLLNNGDVSLFVRLGSDFTGNYYEYEIPLTLTPWGTAVTSVDAIWPESNALNLDIKKLTDLKIARNAAVRANEDLSFTVPYVQYDGANKMTILGTPNIGDVKTIVIGIRNSKQTSGNLTSDDGQPKSVEVWINELRMTDFDEEGGWAANTRIAANLADLGNVVLAGTHSTAGFGGIEQKINERQKDNITRYDVATNVELGKFLPEKSGIKIPMHFDYSETKQNPEYNPINPDIKLKEDLESYSNEDEKEEVKKKVQDYTMQKSINFTNVRKEKTGGGKKKNRIYDVENLDFTYAYTETFHRNFDIKHNLLKTYYAAVGYNFNNTPKNIAPFAKNKFLTKAKPLKLIKDFNFYLAPKLISFRNDLNREYEENVFRNKLEAIIPMNETYIKSFDWGRQYNVKFDLSRGLKLDYTANASSWLREPPGTKIEKGEAWKPLFDHLLDSNDNKVGDLTTYAQTVNISYNIPVNKLPMMDWLSLRGQYNGQYNWDRASPAAEQLGNTIYNSNSKKLNANANVVNLYNKVGYLKKLNKPQQRKRRTERFEAEDEEENDSTKNKVQASEILKKVLDNSLRAMMALRNVTVSRTENMGTQLPGFIVAPTYIGRNWNAVDENGNSLGAAPGLDYVFGSPFMVKHDTTIIHDAYRNGWISRDSSLNSAFATQYMKNINVKASFEPAKKLKIDLNADWQKSSNMTMYFDEVSLNRRKSEGIDIPQTHTGNFSMSFATFQTAWVSDYDDNSNKNFKRFMNYRDDISARLSYENRENSDYNPNWNNNGDTAYYQDGYGPLSQDVLIPAFLAAYSGQHRNEVQLTAFPKVPIPNWRVTFDGLSDIEFIKKYFKRVSLSHGYRCAYTVGGYGNVLQYEEDGNGRAVARYPNNNFIPENEINQVSIREQFNPLVKVDLTWHNSLNTTFELKKARELNLSFINYQLTEVSRNDVVVGVGYRIKDVRLKIGGNKNKKPMKSDLNLKADVAVGRNKTVLRKIVEQTHTPSAGQRMITINTTADYQLSKSLTFRLYFDRIITKPFVSNQYPTANTNAGISLRFTLVQ